MVGTVASHGELGPAGQRLVRGRLVDDEADRSGRPLMGRGDDGKGQALEPFGEASFRIPVGAAGIGVEGRQQMVPEDVEHLLHVVDPGRGRDDEVRVRNNDTELAVRAVAAEPCRAIQYW